MQYPSASVQESAGRRSVRSRAACKVRLARLHSGVAAGVTRRSGSGASTESWTAFTSREQFDACWDEDPLKFDEPLRFAQLKTEFDHVLDGRR